MVLASGNPQKMLLIIFSKQFCFEEASGLASEMAQRERITVQHVKSHQCPLVNDCPGTHLRSNSGGIALCCGDASHCEDQ